MVCKIYSVGSLSLLGLFIAIFRPLHYCWNTQKRRGDVEDCFNSLSIQDVPKAYRIRWESLFLRHFESPVVMKSWWRADETLPPPPTTTTLYSLRNDALDMASWMFSTTGNSTREKTEARKSGFSGSMDAHWVVGSVAHVPEPKNEPERWSSTGFSVKIWHSGLSPCSGAWVRGLWNAKIGGQCLSSPNRLFCREMQLTESHQVEERVCGQVLNRKNSSDNRSYFCCCCN